MTARTVDIDGITIMLARPDETAARWVGQHEVLKQLLAAWLVLVPDDLPLNPRLIGKPGVGKTSLALAAAKRLGQPAYLFQATMDTRPEDLIVTPVVASDRSIHYVASPIVTAMVSGGIAILDEGNRMSEKSWASLASLLDHRRYVDSIVAGIRIKAHPAFRFCATMNDDSSTFDIPDYIQSRVVPQIEVDFPEKEEELAILRDQLPFADDAVLSYVTTFLQRAHELGDGWSIRDGINIARYSQKIMAADPQDPVRATQTAIERILGESPKDDVSG